MDTARRLARALECDALELFPLNDQRPVAATPGADEISPVIGVTDCGSS